MAVLHKKEAEKKARETETQAGAAPLQVWGCNNMCSPSASSVVDAPSDCCGIYACFCVPQVSKNSRMPFKAEVTALPSGADLPMISDGPCRDSCTLQHP